ncbi:hypothetical protein SAPIO_CDS1235 [Scedosporium apiospermum]|uniref:NAD-dependent epimerase/dehydratase domain-containing protein n=1 Tax=Pseudallescheria apiosperma TaxID=563466 RepID=A0A084GEV8_PSEDA|nr:uncharacterized protein SAPIO_CDS1235 [Scedosporium apiospermum]KEZ45870.1 hypothetical protein SAPIO_CDS1235 [Scedosporium apiospermum]
MTHQLNALHPGSIVLITGVNGYIGSHIANILLGLGFRVRGTVRSPKPWLDEMFTAKFGEGVFETTLLSGFDDVPSLERVMDGVAAVIHVATDLTFGSDPKAIIPWVVKATENMLVAAASQPQVKRFVLTSSSTAAVIPVADKLNVRVGEGTFNEAAITAAWDPATPDDFKFYAVYAASKTQGEKAAWNWIKENKPNFVFNTVLPSFNTGEILHPEIHGSTMGWVRLLLKGDKLLFSRFPPEYSVDVKDTARLHVIGLLGPDVRFRRLFAWAHSVNITDLITTLRSLRPDNKLIPDPPENDGRDLTEVVPAAAAQQLLKQYFGQDGWTDFSTSVAEGIEDLD